MKFKQTYKELWTKTSLPASIFNIYYFLSLLMTISEKGQIRIQLNNSDAYGSRSAILRIACIKEIKAQRFWIVKITGAKLNIFFFFFFFRKISWFNFKTRNLYLLFRWGQGVLCKHGDFYTCTDRYNPGVLQQHKERTTFMQSFLCP